MDEGKRTADRTEEAGSSAAATIRAYYATLRAGEPLVPYFSSDPQAVKFGLTERLSGYEEIAEGLRTQTETTTDWEVASHALTVGERADHAWFADSVSMAWRDLTTGERHDYETRWSGTLERVEQGEGGTDDGTDVGDAEGEDRRENRADWQFVSMHVSREC